jgi:hypothetical protein
MSHMGKSHLVVMFTVGPDDVAEGDRIFASHGEWMKGHPRENWPDMSAAVAWSAKGTVATLHNGTAVQALW